MTQTSRPDPTSAPVWTSEKLDCLASAARSIIAQDPDPAIVAIPELHIRNAHPNSLKMFQPLLDPRHAGQSNLRKLLSLLAALVRSVRSDGRLWHGDNLSGHFDVLIVSHLLNSASAKQNSDLYFAELPDRLADKGLRVAVALVNHSGKDWAEIKPGWSATKAARVVLSSTLGLADETSILRRLWQAGRRLIERPADGALPQALLRLTSRQATASGSRDAARIAAQVDALLKTLRPAALITTFEGHSWERLVFRAARKSDPNTLRFGYNHAVLFPGPYGLTQRFGQAYDPDIILTCGEVTRDQLRLEPALAGVPVEALGSARVMKPEPLPRDRPAVCLVLPEGLLEECVALIRPALQAALLAPNLQFVVRLHPMAKRSEIEARLPDLKVHPQNFKWSAAQSLNEDLSSARWALYRGSSAAIQAAQSGLRPYYVALNQEAFSIDPLQPLTSWRERVETAEELVGKLNEDLLPPHSEREVLARSAAAFCDKYFTPFDADVVLTLMKRSGSAANPETRQ